MTAADPSPSHEPPPPAPLPPLVRGLLFFGVLFAIVGAAYWSMASSSMQRGGAIALETPMTSVIDSTTEPRRVPGRENEMLDRADLWHVDLRAGETVTVHACASSRSGRATNPTPQVVVHGPAGVDDHREASGPSGLPPWRAAIVYTPTSSGEHAIWVYKRRDQSPYSYHLEVLPGAQPEPSGDLCALPYD